MGIEGTNPNPRLAESEVLPAGKPGETTESLFNYASTVGILQ